ncbi:MAG: MarR family transcriptional regulator [Actinomycetota bacterium]|nr:MarR family transcriptional regulator [Actinomycetota bacterium]MDH4353311.1 MarR family transcriptional regulator [Actinomycetota bacterium]MDH5277763.1 MarR family transcriptional regulator [Actinomycetota bacterium]
MGTLLVRDTELASTLRISVMRLARRLRAERAETGLTLTQLSTLAALERHGPSSPGVLAELEKVQPPSMTRIVTSLENRGLVARSAHPTDGRQVVVSATADARELLRADRRRREEWLSRQLAEMTPDERESLRAVAPLLERLAGT